MSETGRLARAMEVFNAAAELPLGERGAFLDRVCADDSGLRAEVESLLANDADDSVLGQPALAAVNVARFARLDGGDTAALPTEIGPYQVLGLLGTGGMGIVYRARQTSPAREVALKLIRPELSTPTSRRRFRTEIETLARLHHPGIAAIYAAEILNTPTGAQPYIVMEHVRGMPLLEFAQTRRLSHRARLGLLARLCDAVEHAHQRGVIHRDLKPPNILVEEIDGVPQPRILDFGVARLMNQSAAATAMTAPGQVVGTLAYMSPEQAEGDPQGADTRSDVYSLGAIAYELLCGKLPIDVAGSSTFAAIKAVRERIPLPLAAHDRALRGDVDTIVQKALAKDRDARYASAAALAADLRHYLASEPIRARKPSFSYVLRKFTARHKLLVSAAAVAALGIVGGGVGMTFGLIRAQRAAAELQSEIRQSSETASLVARDVVAHLDAIAGTVAVRQRLLELLDAQVNDLLKRSPGDATLLATQAAILTQRSDLALAEGLFDHALALRENALSIQETLAAAEPDNFDRQADLSINLVKVGDVFKGRRMPERARMWYERAYAIDARLARENPDSRHYLDNLGWSCDRLGLSALGAGDVSRAQELLQRRVEINRRLLEFDPANLTTLHGTVQAEAILAQLVGANDAAAGSAHRAAALAGARNLVHRAPHNRVYLHELAMTLANVAIGDDSADTRSTYEEATARCRELLDLEPNDVIMREALISTLLYWAHYEVACDDTARAAQLVAQAHALRRAWPDETLPPGAETSDASLAAWLLDLRAAETPASAPADALKGPASPP